MKEIQTKSGEILIVEVPEDAYDIRFIPTGDLIYKITDKPYQSLFNVMKGRTSIRCELIGKLSELTDKDCEEFVELTPTGLFKLYNWSKEKVDELGIQPVTYSAKDSFISLLQSENIDVSKEYLIIKVL